MTPQSILLGLGAGLISAIVFASATTGAAVSRVVLYLLTPFSLYLAGLGLGFLPVLVAGVAGTLFILAISNPATALFYAVSEVMPAIVLTRLAHLSYGEGENRRWYPIGRIVIASAIIAGFLGAVFLALQGADIESLTQAVRPQIEEFVKTQIPSIPGSQTLSEEQIKEMTEIVVASLPGALAWSLMLISLVSLWLAGRLTLASGRLERPWPDFSKLQLPLGSAVLLLVATLLSFSGDKVWLLTDGFASALRLAFAILGLAVVHHVTLGSPWRGFILSTVYAALLILTRHMLLILALIGLAETIFHYRNAAQKNAQPPDPRNS
jgi:hypothetical protein